MPETGGQFEYVAIDAAGRRVKGRIAARNDAGAFERLKRDGLSPLRIVAASKTDGLIRGAGRLSDRDAAELLAGLAALLKAGADMRSSLTILSAKAEQSALREVCRRLSEAISGGGALDLAFADALAGRQGFVSALIAAGETSGDLAGGLQRAADILQSRLKMRDQLVSTLTYPMFVLASTMAALAVILLMVVPSLAPLAEAPGARPGLAISLLLGASHVLRENLVQIGAGLLVFGLGLVALARLGVLTRPMQVMALDGPMGRTMRALTYGGYAITLGEVLSAGAPVADALRLATRSVSLALAQERLAPVAQAVRQGEGLSNALGRVKDIPGSITRLAAIGEETGALGAMLARGGALEEAAAIRRIESLSRILGPALIVALGGVIGLLMAGLLSGVSGLGDAALN